MEKKKFNLSVVFLLITIIVLFFMPFIFRWNTVGSMIQISLAVIFAIYSLIYGVLYIQKKIESGSYIISFIFLWITLLLIALLEYFLYFISNKSKGIGPGVGAIIPIIFFGALAFITLVISIISTIIAGIKKDSKN
jgi:hypothetical protein